jgi:hypothetical protein
MKKLQTVVTGMWRSSSGQEFPVEMYTVSENNPLHLCGIAEIFGEQVEGEWKANVPFNGEKVNVFSVERSNMTASLKKKFPKGDVILRFAPETENQILQYRAQHQAIRDAEIEKQEQQLAAEAATIRAAGFLVTVESESGPTHRAYYREQPAMTSRLKLQAVNDALGRISRIIKSISTNDLRKSLEGWLRSNSKERDTNWGDYSTTDIYHGVEHEALLNFLTPILDEIEAQEKIREEQREAKQQEQKRLHEEKYAGYSAELGRERRESGSDGYDYAFSATITAPSGKRYQFRVRNVFDVGLVVNPASGGLLINIETYKPYQDKDVFLAENPTPTGYLRSTTAGYAPILDIEEVIAEQFLYTQIPVSYREVRL